VRARAFVVCGGGIENPRLLLASNTVMPGGVGNARGLVGRFFQDHPSGTTGTLATGRPRVVQEQFRKLRRAGVTFWPKLALTEAAQRRGHYLNANSLMLYDYAETSALARAKEAVEAVKSRQVGSVARAGLRMLRHLPELAGRLGHTVVTGKAPVFAPSRVMLKAHVEQVPNPDNRVSLAAERDRFGVPRARLAWRVHPDELRTLRAITEAVGHEFHRLGLGEMTVSPWLDQGVDAARPELEDTYHHAGTTRMSTSAAEGVTDPDCLVFGTGNLYMAGGSVFPTSGYANPTLTIVALALRLSETLRQRFAPA
jgi:choline dehydrogenase-like flavoprotein